MNLFILGKYLDINLKFIISMHILFSFFFGGKMFFYGKGIKNKNNINNQNKGFIPGYEEKENSYNSKNENVDDC